MNIITQCSLLKNKKKFAFNFKYVYIPFIISSKHHCETYCSVLYLSPDAQRQGPGRQTEGEKRGTSWGVDCSAMILSHEFSHWTLSSVHGFANMNQLPLFEIMCLGV